MKEYEIANKIAEHPRFEWDYGMWMTGSTESGYNDGSKGNYNRYVYFGYPVARDSEDEELIFCTSRECAFESAVHQDCVPILSHSETCHILVGHLRELLDAPYLSIYYAPPEGQSPGYWRTVNFQADPAPYLREKTRPELLLALFNKVP